MINFAWNFDCLVLLVHWLLEKNGSSFQSLEMHQVFSFKPSQQRISSGNCCILCWSCTSFRVPLCIVRQVQVCQWLSLTNYFQQKMYHYLPRFTTNITKFFKLTTKTKNIFSNFLHCTCLKRTVWQQRLFFIPSPSFKLLHVVPILTSQVWVLFFFVANC